MSFPSAKGPTKRRCRTSSARADLTPLLSLPLFCPVHLLLTPPPLQPLGATHLTHCIRTSAHSHIHAFAFDRHMEQDEAFAMTREQLDGLLDEIRHQQREHSDLDAQLLESEVMRRSAENQVKQLQEMLGSVQAASASAANDRRHVTSVQRKLNHAVVVRPPTPLSAPSRVLPSYPPSIRSREALLLLLLLMRTHCPRFPFPLLRSAGRPGGG